MKATKQNLEDLLALATIDQNVERNTAAAQQILGGSSLSEIRQRQRELALQLLEASNLCESLTLELKRASADVAVVDDRIKKDRDQLNQTSSSKDAQGIESELVSLARRKSDLEDATLGVMDELEGAEATAAGIKAAKDNVDAEIGNLEQSAQQELLKLQSGIALAKEQRAQISGALTPELVELYEKKAKRGVAAARLVGRDCNACHISLTAAAYDDFVSRSQDEVSFCPECQAILVRS